MNITEKAISFNEIERYVQWLCHKFGCELLRKVLEEWDDALAKERDRKEYRDKGKRKRVIKTVLGEVECRRRVYETQDDSGKTVFVYLLDEAMGLSGSGCFSEMLSEQIAQASCAMSYREAARTVKEMTGQDISHTAVWCATQVVSEQIGEGEKRAAELAAADEGRGTIEAKLLFEEQDGIYLTLQGKDRKKHGPSKEMKVAIAYDGMKNVTKKVGGKPRYEATNKVACASFKSVDDFVELKEGLIAEVYNVDEIEMRALNGDGARWIKRSKTNETVHYHLDVFHRNEAVLKYVSDSEARKTIMKLLYSKDIDLLLHTIEVYALNAKDEDEREKYMTLHGYFQNNKDGLVPYNQRGLDLPEPPEGKEYRGMGTMESNVFTLIGNRMKGGRANWSINGGNNLARLLCLKYTNKLHKSLKELSECVLLERYMEEITMEFSAAMAPKTEGKGYDSHHKFAIPASQKWLKDIAALKPFCSI